jgi:dTDP-4-dehydrorhamnose reductase
VRDVADATVALVDHGEPGLYHCVGTGHASWHEVGLEIARVLGQEREAKLIPVSVTDVTLRAPRPRFAALSNEKLSRVLPLPSWQDALRRYLKSDS